MKNFIIKEPFWKYNSIGIAERDMTDNILSINILYENLDGTRRYPDTFYIRKNLAMHGRLHIVKSTRTRLRIIPIEKLSKDENNC